MVCAEPLECPGKRGGGGLVSRADDCDQLVAKLLVAHGAAVVVLGGQEEREHVVVGFAVPSERRAAISS